MLLTLAWLLQVDQQEEQNEAAGNHGVVNSLPPSFSHPETLKDKATTTAPEAALKQGQEAESGTAGEGRVIGNGKQGNLTQTECRSRGMC